jgi:dTDP-4-dehydrorhamnose 3,5-epimerase-like enzyme
MQNEDIPYLISGGVHSDPRGNLYYNNGFNASAIKRFYVVENKNQDLIRGWQGHKIERRWFSCINGSFSIQLILIDNWENPSMNCKKFNFELTSKNLDVLSIPSGFVSSIQSIDLNSKLLVMSDHLLGEINDEYKFDSNRFTKTNILD